MELNADRVNTSCEETDRVYVVENIHSFKITSGENSTYWEATWLLK